jgi:hypothetical protein
VTVFDHVVAGPASGRERSQQSHHALGVVTGAVCAFPFIDARIDTGANVIGP